MASPRPHLRNGPILVHTTPKGEVGSLALTKGFSPGYHLALLDDPTAHAPILTPNGSPKRGVTSQRTTNELDDEEQPTLLYGSELYASVRPTQPTRARRDSAQSEYVSDSTDMARGPSSTSGESSTADQDVSGALQLMREPHAHDKAKNIASSELDLLNSLHPSADSTPLLQGGDLEDGGVFESIFAQTIPNALFHPVDMTLQSPSDVVQPTPDPRNKEEQPVDVSTRAERAATEELTVLGGILPTTDLEPAGHDDLDTSE